MRLTQPVPQPPLAATAAASLALALTLIARASSPAEPQEPRADDRRFLETVLRIDNPALLTSPSIREKLSGVLDRSRGTDLFVAVIRKLELRERVSDLVETAATRPGESHAVAAARLSLEWDGPARFAELIRGKDEARAATAIAALGYAQSKASLTLLADLASDRAGAARARRLKAIEALAYGSAGEAVIVERAEAGRLPDDLALAAAQAIHNSSDPKLRERGTKVLPLPRSADAAPLPPLAELLRRTGDPTRGPAAFRKAGCVQCHRVNDQGVDFGPALSDIGNKLAKDGLYTAILDPSASIEHSYQGVSVSTFDGTRLSGFVVSETDRELALKVPGGIVMTLAKDDIDQRDKLDQSLMPQGLQSALSASELIDLVEWLSTLKAAKKP